MQGITRPYSVEISEFRDNLRKQGALRHRAFEDNIAMKGSEWMFHPAANYTRRSRPDSPQKKHISMVTINQSVRSKRAFPRLSGKFVVDNFEEIKALDRTHDKNKQKSADLDKSKSGSGSAHARFRKARQTDSKFGIAKSKVIEAVKLISSMRLGKFSLVGPSRPYRLSDIRFGWISFGDRCAHGHYRTDPK